MWKLCRLLRSAYVWHYIRDQAASAEVFDSLHVSCKQMAEMLKISRNWLWFSYLSVSQCSSRFWNWLFTTQYFLGRTQWQFVCQYAIVLPHLFQHPASLICSFEPRLLLLHHSSVPLVCSVATLFHSHNYTPLQLYISLCLTCFNSQKFFWLIIHTPQLISRWTTGQCSLFADWWPAHLSGHNYFFHQQYDLTISNFSQIWVGRTHTLTSSKTLSNQCLALYWRQNVVPA